jgi:ribose transport system permease protein
MFTVFSLLGSSFVSAYNIMNILSQSSIYGVMALGMTFLIVCGYFDLSVGTVMGFSANLVILLMIKGVPIWASVVIVLVTSIAIGAINGLLVTKANINAFIVTLAMMLVMHGLTYFLCKGDQISSPDYGFSRYANGDIGGMSYLTITFFIFVVAFWFIMKFTRYGRNVYAIGGNADAAFNAGIKVAKARVFCFVLCSFTAGVGGVMTASKMNGATAYLGYPDGALIVITCVVLGGTSLLGGSGGMLYTLGGTIAYIMFRNGLNMMNVDAAYNYIATGIILISIVTFDALSLNREPGRIGPAGRFGGMKDSGKKVVSGSA